MINTFFLSVCLLQTHILLQWIFKIKIDYLSAGISKKIKILNKQHLIWIATEKNASLKERSENEEF